MKTNIRTGYVHLRNGDWFATVDGDCEPAFVVARSLKALTEKARRLRNDGHEIGTTAWEQIGTGSNAYTKPHARAV
jgi:hypothetical protein